MEPQISADMKISKVIKIQRGAVSAAFTIRHGAHGAPYTSAPKFKRGEVSADFIRYGAHGAPTLLLSQSGLVRMAHPTYLS
jgi:hypothetical protein